MTEVGEAAVRLASMGVAVFPLKPRGKDPATRHGVKDATTDMEGLAEFFDAHPDCNLGAAMGAASGGVFAIDFDVDEDAGKDGFAALREWELGHGALPDTASAVTGGGGYHLFYRMPGGATVRNSVNRELGVDVRGDGGYVAVEPSVHPSGRRYEWERPPWETPIAEADANVMAFLEHVRPARAASDPDGPRLETPESIGEGGRNDALFRAGASMRAKRVDPAVIADALRGINSTRCNPPLPDAEVDVLISSVLALPEGHSEEYERKRPDSDGKENRGSVKDSRKTESIRGPRGGLRTNVVARTIIERNHARMIDGAPAVWTGRRWEFGTRAINRCVLRLADDAKKQEKSEVVSYIMDSAPNFSSDNSFDGRYYVQFSNATIDVVSGDIVTPSPEMYIVGTLPVPLDMDIGPNLADDFLRSLSGGDSVVELALTEVLGACMCSRRIVSKSPMLIGRAGGSEGKASNGKSTYINWIRSVLGPDNVSSLDIMTLGQRFQAQRVLGKLANLGDDIPDSFLQSDQLSTFKKLVTGDEIYTDVKNSDGFEFRTTATMVFSMNAIPRMSDTTEGIFRRLYLLPFKNRFDPERPGYDPDIGRKLAEPAVLMRGTLLGLTALCALVTRGEFTRIPGMDEEIEEVRQDNDSVARWIYSEDVDADDINGHKVSEVYKEYSLWCKEAGERNPCSMRTFSTRIRESTAFRNVTVVTESIRFGGKTAKAFKIST